MPTDWTKPFPRDAVLITRPDSEEVIFGRPGFARGTPIQKGIYQELEAERQAWLDDRALESAKSWELAEREKVIMQQRLMVKELREFRADEVLAKLGEWKKYADMDRWDQLGKWIEEHPQRLSESDYLFGLLDRPEWKDPHAFEPAPKPPKKIGRPKGTKTSPEAKEKHRQAALARWEDRRARGWVHPNTLDKQRAEERKAKEPY